MTVAQAYGERCNMWGGGGVKQTSWAVKNRLRIGVSAVSENYGRSRRMQGVKTTWARYQHSTWVSIWNLLSSFLPAAALLPSHAKAFT